MSYPLVEQQVGALLSSKNFFSLAHLYYVIISLYPGIAVQTFRQQSFVSFVMAHLGHKAYVLYD